MGNCFFFVWKKDFLKVWNKQYNLFSINDFILKFSFILVLDVSGESTDVENYETKNIPVKKYITSNEKCNIHLEEYFSRR